MNAEKSTLIDAQADVEGKLRGKDAQILGRFQGEIALTGRYDEVSEPDRLVMTVPGDVVTAITLTSVPNGTTQIAYTFDVDESMHAMVTESVDDVLGRVSTVLARLA